MGKYDKIYNILGCDINIPINDMSAWTNFPKYRSIYNRLDLALFQNIQAAPLPIIPKKYPVIVKPIINLYGMGLNTVKVNDEDEFSNLWYNNGFWMEFFEGDHFSWDIIILNNEIVYSQCFIGTKAEKLGKFDYWESIDKEPFSIIKKLVSDKLKGYNGCLNVETINGKIIEAHLRFGDIDTFPTLSILKGIIATYKGFEYNWSNVRVSKVYLFPVWYDTFTNLVNSMTKNLIISIDDILEYLENSVKVTLSSNEFIYECDVDDKTLAGPSDTKRLMWFTCGNLEFGLNMRKSIYDDLLSNFFIY